MHIRSLGLRAAVVLLVFGVSTALAQQPQGAAPAAGGAQGQGQGQAGGGRGGGTPLLFTIAGWEDGGVIPAKYTTQTGVSPEMKWSQVPAGTQSFVLLMHDLDVAPGRNPMAVTHWLVWNIPGTATGLPENVPQGAELPDGTRQVSQRMQGYAGPGAPPGPYHHYAFELFALDIKLEVPAATPQETATVRAAIMKAMEGHVIGKSAVFGRFHR